MKISVGSVVTGVAEPVGFVACASEAGKCYILLEVSENNSKISFPSKFIDGWTSNSGKPLCSVPRW